MPEDLGGGGAAVAQLVIADPALVIDEAGRHDEATLTVDHEEASAAQAIIELVPAQLELLPASQVGDIAPGVVLAVRGLEAILAPIAIVGERRVQGSVIALDGFKVAVGDGDQA